MKTILVNYNENKLDFDNKNSNSLFSEIYCIINKNN